LCAGDAGPPTPRIGPPRPQYQHLPTEASVGELVQRPLEPGRGRGERVRVGGLEHDLDRSATRAEARTGPPAHPGAPPAAGLEHGDEAALGRAVAAPP